MGQWALIKKNTWSNAPHLSAESKLIRCYLSTNERINLIGLYRIPFILISHESSVDIKRIPAITASLEESGIAYYDQTTELVYVPEVVNNYINYGILQPPRNKMGAQQLYSSMHPTYLLDLLFDDFGERLGLTKRPDSGTIEHPENMEPHGSKPSPNPSAPASPDQQALDENTIRDLLARYDPTRQATIRRFFDALATTRKGGKIQPGIIRNCLAKWSALPVDRVMYGLKVYLDKNLHLDNKAEAYVLAIMKNASEKELNTTPMCAGIEVSSVTEHNLRVFRELEEERLLSQKGLP